MVSLTRNQVVSFTGISTVGAINEEFQRGSQIRIDDLQLEKQAQIDIAGTNKDARLAIEKEYNDKIRAEKIRGYKEAKVAAMFTVAINTATAIVGALAPPPVGLGPVAGIPFSIAAGVLGAAQLAMIAARPIPKFRTGTQSAPGGLAEVAEDGPEAIISPSGHLRIAHKRQITYLEPKSKVLTTPETKRFLTMKEIDNITDLHSRLSLSVHERRHEDQTRVMAAAFNASRVDPNAIGEAVGKHMASLPFTSTTFDENGVNTYIQTRSTRTKILNDRYSLK